jgi:hypothetical protein
MLLLPAVEVDARPLPLPVATGGVGGGASSDVPPFEPRVDERWRPRLPICGRNAGEDLTDGDEWSELLLTTVVPGAAKLMELAGREVGGIEPDVSSEARGAIRLDRGGLGRLRLEGESCELRTRAALVENRGLSVWFGGRLLIGRGNSELRFLFRRPDSHMNDVCERDGRGGPGVGGLESGWSPGVESPVSFACSSWSGMGSALAEAALGASNVNNCSLARLPANFLNSSSGSFLPNRNVANLDLRFSTLLALSSPAFGLDFCRTKGRNLDLRRLSG